MNSDIILQELQQFARALPEADRKIFLQLLKEPLKHLGSISYASSFHTWAFLLVCIILEQEKKIMDLGCLQGKRKDNFMVENRE
jgi:hypothetical protein